MTTLRSSIPATPALVSSDATRDAFADRAMWRTQLCKRRLEPLPRGADAAFDTLVGQIACRLPRTGALLRRADAVLKLDARRARR